MSDISFEYEDVPGVATLEDSEASTMEVSSLAAYVEEQFNRSYSDRREQEERWVDSYLNFRGLEHERTSFTETETSKVFIKVTKTKVNAAYGLLHEIMFPNFGNSFPISVKPTPVPEGVEKSVHIAPNAPPEDSDDMGKGRRFNLGGMTEKLDPVKDKLRAGPGKVPGAVTFNPSKTAAQYMDEKMQDQFHEGGAHEALRRAIFDSVLYGTGIMKGPFSVEKEYPYWDQDKEGNYTYNPVVKRIPKWEHIRLWDFYPDPEATSDDDMEWCVVRRKMTKTQLRALKKRSSFRDSAVDNAIAMGPNYTEDWWENDIDDDQNNVAENRYKVLEYWGTIDREEFDDEISDNFDLPKEFDDYEELNVSIWVCNGEVLKFTINPYKPQTIPFHTFRYEYNPNNFFGVGMAENMADTQILMNGFMRMAIDNAALSGNLIWEVDEDALAPGQNMERMEPGKVLRRQAGAVGQAVTAIKPTNVTQENMLVYDKARQMADESTGFPSFAHGQTGVSGVGRTASGISMLMGAASTVIKTVVKSFDTTLERIGASLFTYNMTFDFDPKALGDITINSRGIATLVSQEIRAQRLGMFMQQVANPILAQFVKWPVLIREMAVAMDLDPDELLNSPEEAALQAMKMQQMQGLPGQGGGMPAGPKPTDTQGGGGGVPGVGVPQQPGQPGFTGTPGGMG